LSANLVVPTNSEDSSQREVPVFEFGSRSEKLRELKSLGISDVKTRLSLSLIEERVSLWSHSWRKRTFDLFCVVLVLPLIIPVCLLIGLAIRLTSRGPVLFLQRRMGANRRRFTILKFRTMEHRESGRHNSVTTTENQRFTPIGPFLRRWKLDELPQLFNVLRGDMSLVGPRPKLPEHQLGNLRCRPGITGAATLAFAREEEVLATLPDHHLEGYYHSVILPAKYRLDGEYMARATFLSDLKLLIDTALRRWNSATMLELLRVEELELQDNPPKVKTPAQKSSPSRVTTITRDESFVSGD
jgi:lipopolysaccharide/colanic/teichoic acid biosynthesis glycosyltransferase